MGQKGARTIARLERTSAIFQALADVSVQAGLPPSGEFNESRLRIVKGVLRLLGRIHATGRFFMREEVITMPYHHVWTVTDREAAYVGLVALPGEFMDEYYGYCVTDRPWGWDFYQSGGYAVLTNGGDVADDRFDDEGVIPLPSSTELRDRQKFEGQ